jgi:hypothetical protein
MRPRHGISNALKQDAPIQRSGLSHAEVSRPQTKEVAMTETSNRRWGYLASFLVWAGLAAVFWCAPWSLARGQVGDWLLLIFAAVLSIMAVITFLATLGNWEHETTSRVTSNVFWSIVLAPVVLIMLGLLIWVVVGNLNVFPHMSFDFLTIVVILNALATFVLWSERRPEKIKKKFRKQLYDTKPITPKHQPPKAIGGKFESCVSEEDRVFFADFADFANVVNWWLADEDFGSRWRLQELPETELRLHGVFDSGPTFGRSYAVFYNQVRLGALEVHPFLYSTEQPRVITYIHLDNVRLLSFETIRDFFAAIAMYAGYDSPDSKEYLKAQQAIDRALTGAMWQNYQIDVYNIGILDRIEALGVEDFGQIDLRLDGPATYYLERRESLRKQATASQNRARD